MSKVDMAYVYSEARRQNSENPPEAGTSYGYTVDNDGTIVRGIVCVETDEPGRRSCERVR